MKVERSAPTRAARNVGAAAYARRVEASSAVDAVDAVLPTSILGIPEAEFTPRVRDAIMGLMGDVDNLRRELTQTRVRLEEVEKSADQDQLLPLDMSIDAAMKMIVTCGVVLPEPPVAHLPYGP